MSLDVTKSLILDHLRFRSHTFQELMSLFNYSVSSKDMNSHLKSLKLNNYIESETIKSTVHYKIKAKSNLTYPYTKIYTYKNYGEFEVHVSIALDGSLEVSLGKILKTKVNSEEDLKALIKKELIKWMTPFIETERKKQEFENSTTNLDVDVNELVASINKTLDESRSINRL